MAAGGGDGAEAPASGDAQLDLDQVDAGDLLAHAVLDLQAGVDLQEPQVAVGGQEELAGGHAHVVDGLQQAAGGPDQAGVQALGQVRGRSLLQELLVAPLQGAVAGGHDGEGAVAVAGALGLDVPGGRDELLQDEGAAGSGRRLEGGGGADLLLGGEHRNAAPAPAVGALEGHGVAVGGGEVDDGVGAGHRVGDAGDGGDAGPLGGGARAHLVPQRLHGLRRGAHPGDACVHDGPGEVGAFGQEAVAGVDGVGAGAPGQVEDRRGVGVGRALGQGVGLVGELGGRAEQVLGGVGQDGGSAQVSHCAHDAQGDLPPVGDEDAVRAPSGHRCAPKVWWGRRRRPAHRPSARPFPVFYKTPLGGPAENQHYGAMHPGPNCGILTKCGGRVVSARARGGAAGPLVPRVPAAPPRSRPPRRRRRRWRRRARV